MCIERKRAIVCSWSKAQHQADVDLFLSSNMFDLQKCPFNYIFFAWLTTNYSSSAFKCFLGVCSDFPLCLIQLPSEIISIVYFILV